MIEVPHRAVQRSVRRGCQGRSPGLWWWSDEGTDRPLEGTSRSEQPTPTNTKGQGCRGPAESALATRKLGWANNLQNNPQNRWGVPARTGGRYTPGHPGGHPVGHVSDGQWRPHSMLVVSLVAARNVFVLRLQTSLIARELKRSVHGCCQLDWQRSARLTRRGVRSCRTMLASTAARERDE